MFKVFENDPPKETPPTTFTQEQVNKFLAEEKKKYEEKSKKTISQLEDLKKSVGLTAKQKEELEGKIEELNSLYLTAEQKAKQDSEKLSNKHKKELETLLSERDTWRHKFHSSTIERAILDAANINDVDTPSLMVKLLKSDAKLVELAEKPGEFETRIEFDDVVDNKPTKLLLTPDEVIKKMKEKETHKGFFKSTATGGVGAQNKPGKVPGVLSDKPPLHSTAEFMKWRKEQRKKT